MCCGHNSNASSRRLSTATRIFKNGHSPYRDRSSGWEVPLLARTTTVLGTFRSALGVRRTSCPVVSDTFSSGVKWPEHEAVLHVCTRVRVFRAVTTSRPELSLGPVFIFRLSFGRTADSSEMLCASSHAYDCPDGMCRLARLLLSGTRAKVLRCLGYKLPGMEREVPPPPQPSSYSLRHGKDRKREIQKRKLWRIRMQALEGDFSL